MNRHISYVALAATLLLSPLSHAKDIRATLKLHARVSMEDLARNVQDPTSNHYQRFYEPEEIRQLAGPSDSEYQDLVASLKNEGLTVVHESPTHLWLTVHGPQATYESLFATNLQSLGNGVHRHLQSPSVPRHLGLIDSVTGLDNTRKSRPHMVKPLAGPKAPTGISQATIKSLYGFNALYKSGLTGKNQHIAIATYNGFNIANVKKFYALSKLSPVPNVEQVQFNGPPTYDEGSAGETELDSEFAGMIAPGVNIHVFASSSNDDAGEVQMFTAILDDNRSKIVNYSWGGCESAVSVQHRAEMAAVLARAVAQGVNIFVASGDSGSNSCNDGKATADWPAASPFVTAVGGTSLKANRSQFIETGWNGSGGGISGVFDLPSWQLTLGSPFVKRSYPDVAFNADPNSGEAIFTGPAGKEGWQVIGGTSMAAPQWAGFMALVAESRQNAGVKDLGFLNTILYAMPKADRGLAFHDVLSGSNGAFSAQLGWDAVTGLGSMHADVLLTYLKKR